MAVAPVLVLLISQACAVTGGSISYRVGDGDSNVVDDAVDDSDVAGDSADNSDAAGGDVGDPNAGDPNVIDTNPLGNIFYVSPTGDDDRNSGSKALPFSGIEKAMTVVGPGDLIYLRGGTHLLTSTTWIGLRIDGPDGEPEKPIMLWAYPGETPVFKPLYPNTTNVGIRLLADYWHVKGLVVTGVQQRMTSTTEASFNIGFSAHNTNHSIFEQIESHHNGGIGFYLGGNSTDNLVLNGDFHHNADPLTVGYAYGNADGMHIRIEYPNTENTVRGCRSWNNSDDGYDTWYTSGVVRIERSWAFWNGFREKTTGILGDGNGFKLGPYTNREQAPDLTVPLRVVTRSIAFQNKANGFDRNGGEMMMYIYNNTAYENLRGFFFNFSIPFLIRNNAALGNTLPKGIDAVADDTFNTWNEGFSISADDFMSLDPSEMSGPRSENGDLPDTNFLRLKPDSLLVNAGTDVGLSYQGEAPDIGARETN